MAYSIAVEAVITALPRPANGPAKSPCRSTPPPARWVSPGSKAPLWLQSRSRTYWGDRLSPSACATKDAASPAALSLFSLVVVVAKYVHQQQIVSSRLLEEALHGLCQHMRWLGGDSTSNSPILEHLGERQRVVGRRLELFEAWVVVAV